MTNKTNPAPDAQRAEELAQRAIDSARACGDEPLARSFEIIRTALLAERQRHAEEMAGPRQDCDEYERPGANAVAAVNGMRAELTARRAADSDVRACAEGAFRTWPTAEVRAAAKRLLAADFMRRSYDKERIK